MAKTNHTIKVGCVLPIGGFESKHARSQLLAARLAVEEGQQELDLPFDVELVERDDEVSPDKAIRITRELIADEDVLAVVGPMNSDTNLAVGSIFNEAGLVHIATAASNPTLTQQGWRTFFRMVCNDIHHYRDAARFAVERLEARRIAVVNDCSNFTRPMAEGFRDTVLELGAEIPLFLGVRRGRDDYSDAAKALAAVDYDLIFFVAIEDVARIIAPQVREAGVRVPFFATDGLKPFPYYATPEYEVQGPYYTNVCADPRVKMAAGEMVKRYIDRFDEEPTLYMAEAYDAAKIILAALERTGSDEPTREEVLREVAATKNFAGTSGNITFDENGDILNPEIGIYKVIGRELKFLGYTRDLVQ
jgi:branched-chain amino acid transport system substrate-binding protein